MIDDPSEPSHHYRYRISLRLRHPSADPKQITDALGMEPRHSWKMGELRQAPSGRPLTGVNRETYWHVEMAAGSYPETTIDDAVHGILGRLIKHRAFLHRIRSEGGSAELFVGWFFEKQSGDVLHYGSLALAGDLRVDLSLDVYPPSQPHTNTPCE